MTRRLSPADAARIVGHLPFYSVDTKAEADALTELAIEAGEFRRLPSGEVVEARLAYEQTPANLIAAGEALAELHRRLLAERPELVADATT